MDFADLAGRGLVAQGVAWALNTDAICARKILEAHDRDVEWLRTGEDLKRRFFEVGDSIPLA